MTETRPTAAAPGSPRAWLPCTRRALLWGERLIGFWEYDLDREEIVTATFEPLPAALRPALDEERRRLAAFIRDQLGNAQSFSLDTDDAVRRRAAELRAMA
ncbi:MAG: hypothetical protein D6696_16935 [Acidobacteria bacterium]|nr:MAG: hypothetical protein D6696_16935 [Acidobacteriota bacterium]